MGRQKSHNNKHKKISKYVALPNDIIATIFNFMNGPDLLKLAKKYLWVRNIIANYGKTLKVTFTGQHIKCNDLWYFRDVKDIDICNCYGSNPDEIISTKYIGIIGITATYIQSINAYHYTNNKLDVLRLRSTELMYSYIYNLTTLRILDVSWSCIDDQLLQIMTINNKALKTINLSYCRYITNKGLHCLTDIEELNLHGCRISDPGLVNLKNINNINLSNTRVTDEGLKYITTARIIDVSHCRITDEGLSLLVNARELNISYCSAVNGRCFQALKFLTSVIMKSCYNIMDDSLQGLSQARRIDLTSCGLISDIGVSKLENAEYLSCSNCTKVTDKGLSYLGKLKIGKFAKVKSITNNGLEHLKNITDLDISGCDLIDNAGLLHLNKVRRLNLSSCGGEITNEGLKSLKSIEEIYLYDCGEVNERCREIIRAKIHI